jgi:hypothetical protein
LRALSEGYVGFLVGGQTPVESIDNTFFDALETVLPTPRCALTAKDKWKSTLAGRIARAREKPLAVTHPKKRLFTGF